MEKTNKEEEKSINAPELGGSALSGTWDRLPDLAQEIILKMVNERKTLLACRLVNTAWKKIADKTLEKQSISELKKWQPFQNSRLYSSSLPTMKLIVDGNRNILSMRWNHSALPIIVSQKLGSPFPTNSMHMELEEKRLWPPYGRPSSYKYRQIHMVRELFSSYGHFLTSVSLSHFSTTFEVLNGMLSDMRNLRALTLTTVKLEMTREIEDSQEEDEKVNYYEEEDEEEEVSPWPNLPSLPNLSHLKIYGCSSIISQAIFNSYSSQITTLETTAYINHCPQPFTNLKQLKLESLIEEDPNFRLPQWGQSPFPSLQYFSFIQRCHKFKWEDVIRVVDSLPKTLVHLHLDLDVDLINEMNIQNLNKGMSTFPLLRKLRIPFPRSKMQSERIGMWLLPRFPNLNTLDLIRHPYPFSLVLGFKVEVEEEGTNHVIDIIASGFWSTCSKLEKILVYRDESDAFRDLRRNM